MKIEVFEPDTRISSKHKQAWIWFKCDFVSKFWEVWTLHLEYSGDITKSYHDRNSVSIPYLDCGGGSFVRQRLREANLSE